MDQLVSVWAYGAIRLWRMNIQIQTEADEITSVRINETLIRNVVAAQLGYSDAGRLMVTLTFADDDQDGPPVQGEPQYL